MSSEANYCIRAPTAFVRDPQFRAYANSVESTYDAQHRPPFLPVDYYTHAVNAEPKASHPKRLALAEEQSGAGNRGPKKKLLDAMFMNDAGCESVDKSTTLKGEYDVGAVERQVAFKSIHEQALIQQTAYGVDDREDSDQICSNPLDVSTEMCESSCCVHTSSSSSSSNDSLVDELSAPGKKSKNSKRLICNIPESKREKIRKMNRDAQAKRRKLAKDTLSQLAAAHNENKKLRNYLLEHRKQCKSYGAIDTFLNQLDLLRKNQFADAFTNEINEAFTDELNSSIQTHSLKCESDAKNYSASPKIDFNSNKIIQIMYSNFIGSVYGSDTIALKPELKNNIMGTLSTTTNSLFQLILASALDTNK